MPDTLSKYDQAAADFAAPLGLTLSAELLPARTDGTDWSADSTRKPRGPWDTPSHWRCTLSRPNRPPFVFEFSQGSAHRRWKAKGSAFGARRSDWPKGARPGARIDPSILLCDLTLNMVDVLTHGTEPEPPSLYSVLCSLASDALSYDNSRSFDDWCDDFGFDTDSRRAESCYRACGEHAKALRHLLGDAAYAQLLESEDLR